MQTGMASDCVVGKPLKSPLTGGIHGKEARGKPLLQTKSRQGLLKGVRTKTWVSSQRRGMKNTGSRSEAGWQEAKP